MIKTIVPIFIGKTRSFWLGIFPALLTGVDIAFEVFTTGGNEPVAGAISAILNPMTGWTADEISGFMRTLAPLYALIVAQQRAGVTRPYTLDPSKEKTIAKVVEDGCSAFDAGKKIGAALRNTKL